MTLRFALGAAVIVAAVLPWRAARAQDTDPPEYRSTIDEAVAEFSAGRYEEARVLFKRAHERLPNARTLRGMGMTAYELRMYVQAIRDLEAALVDTRKPLDQGMRANVEMLIAKARAFVGRVRPVLEPSTAKLVVDGRAPVFEADGYLLLDAGTHTLTANADGHKPASVRVGVEGDTEQSVRITLEPLPVLAGGVPAIDPNKPPAPAQTPEPIQPSEPAKAPAGSSDGPLFETIAWVALIGAAGFGATSAAFWLVGDGQYKDLEQSCGQMCPDQQIADSGVETSDLLTTVFLGAAIASGVTAGVFFALGAAAGAEENGEAPIVLGPGSILIRGRL